MFIQFRSQKSVESSEIKSFKPVDDATQPVATKHQIHVELRDGTLIKDIWPSSAERNIALNNLRTALDDRKI